MSRSARPQVLDRLAARTAGPLPAERDRARSGARSSRPAARSSTRSPSRTSARRPRSRTRRRAQRFGSSRRVPARARPSRTIFDEVERGRAEYGVVPGGELAPRARSTSRSTGSSTPTCSSRGEMTLEIAQHLLSRAPRARARSSACCSHPQGLAQCRAVARRSTCPTCRPRRRRPPRPPRSAAADDPTVAAIASDLAGRLYDVPVLRARIEDNPHNATRFLVIGRQPVRAHRARQDVDPLRDEERARRALPHPGAVRGRGINLTQDRIATGASAGPGST